MPSSLHDPRYALFRGLLVQARHEAGLTQMEVAVRLGRPQSFVSKLERGERRLDFPEFVALADAIGIDVMDFLARYRASAGAGR
jgi:transcriptional regulator with XRE-family HTH domain